MSRSKKYYDRNRAAGLERVSVWIRPQDKAKLLEFLASIGVKPAEDRRRLSVPDDHPDLFRK